MTIPNCIVIDESNQLIKDLKQKFPKKSFEELKTEVGTFMSQSNMFDRFPTLEEMNKYYTTKDSEIEVPIEGAEKITNQSKKQEKSEFVDLSVLDEISNLTFRNAQRKTDRVNLIAREFSNIADVTYNQYINKVKLSGGNPIKREQFVANNAYKIAKIVKARRLNPELISSDTIDYIYKFNELQKIQDNWEILLGEAANILYTTEAIILDVYNTEATDGTNLEAENEDDITPDGENNVSLKDGWMVKARELDLRDTLSQETRKILGSIKKIDRNGNSEVDDLGMTRYLEPDTAHLLLLEKISTIDKSEDFIPALKELSARHPWVNQILTIIEEDENKSKFPQIKPKLYNDLRKEFLPYYIQITDKNGKVITKQVNKSPSIFYLLNRWRVMFEQGSIISDYSIYNNKGEFSKKNAQIGLNVISDINKQLNNLTDRQVVTFITENAERINKLLNMVGIDFSNDEIISTLTIGASPLDNLSNILGPLSTIFSQITKKDYIAGTDIINEFSGAFSTIATLFNTIPQGTIIATFREAGRTRQSYAAPSFIGITHNGIKNKDSKKAIEFIEKNYGKYRQFKDENGYKDYWLSLLTDKYKGQDYRNLLDRKIVIHRDGTEFNDWTDSDYFSVALTEFLNSPDSPSIGPTAYYALPLLADAPSAEFIKFKRITDTEELGLDGKYRTAKDIILDKLADVAYSEWERIQMVERREYNRKNSDSLLSGEKSITPIDSFDGKSGKRFNFFPSMNTYEFKNSLRGKSVTEVKEILRNEIEQYERSSFDLFITKYGATAKALGISEKEVEDFFYNNALAYTQMVKLYTTDLAYYKNLNDFQKRFKEVYAMTNRLYTDIPDISKTRKVVYLKDITFTSSVLREINEVLDTAVKEGRLSELSKDYIISQYTKTDNNEGINVTDAQGFVTLDSYKKVMRMIGNWTEEMENAKQRFESGNFSIEDFNVIWQTIKPFEFTHTESRSGVLVKNAKGQTLPYGNLKVPTQYKNSEFLLLAIYTSIAMNQSKSPLLRTLNRWMVDNDIDLVQFKSGVKTGSQAAIDLNNLNTEEEILRVLNKSLEDLETIHLSSWEDYGIQSATPEHLVDHEALMGSQAKKLITADLPETLTISIKDKSLNRDTVYTLFQSLLTAGYIEGFENCVDIFSNIENVASAIQKEMKGNTRYTDEERKACTLRPDGKDFNVPLHDPIQFSRIQQLLNSIIKKNVTKQQSTGASCIQVSNVGLTDTLKVRFNDENGDLIFTDDEWLNLSKVSSSRDHFRLKELRKSLGTDISGYNEYRKRVKANSMAYMECYLPAYTKKFFNVLGKDKGNFNINDLPEELRKCLGYRIPTEAKYSMQSIYIKGFLPQENGSAIMLPSEITTIVGSDFDIDHVYLMLPNVQVGSVSEDEAKKEFTRLNQDYSIDELEEIFGEDSSKTKNGNRVLDFKKWLKAQRELGNYIVGEDGTYHGKKDTYLYKPTVNLDNYLALNSDGSISNFDYQRMYKEVPKYKRDNLILDIFLKVLSSPKLPQQQLKPGGFAEASKQAAIMTILNNMPTLDLVERFAGTKAVNANTLKVAFDRLSSYNNDVLKDIASESSSELNPLSFDTQIYFHSQNANGGKMIGVYAVGNASHSIGEWGTTKLKNEFNFLGVPILNIDNFFAADGTLISENLANFLAASVDNVKDPVLKALNQDTKTGDVTNFLLRAGVPMNLVSLFMTTNFPKFNFTTISSVSENDRELANNLTEDIVLNYKKGILTPEETVAVGNALGYIGYKVNKFSDDLKQITQAFRGDAMSSAPGPSIGHNIIRRLKLEALRDALADDNFSIETNLIDINKLLDDTNYTTESLLNDSIDQKVPFVYAATKCGVTGSNKVLSNIFPQLTDKLVSLITDRTYGLVSYLDLTKMSVEDAAKIIDSFFSELDLYLLQGTKYFGEEDVKKKNLYYLTEFPNKFLALKEKYPDILNTNSLTKNLIVSSKYNGYKRILFTNSGNLTKGLKGTISNDWAMLLATQEQKEVDSEGNERTILSAKDAAEIRNLGFELFKYATNFGLEFSGGTSFIQLAPNIIRRAITDYDRTIREVGDSIGLIPFIEQFIRNHPDYSPYYKKIKANLQLEDSEPFFIKTFNSIDYPKVCKVEDVEGNIVLFLASDTEIIGNNGYYVSKVTYKRLKPLGTVRGFKEYYYNTISPESVIGDSIRASTIESDVYEELKMAKIEDEFVDDESIYLGDWEDGSPLYNNKQVYDEEGNLTKLCL